MASICTKCPLGTGDIKTNCMSGYGPDKDVDVLIVGEAPGKQDDDRGRPFQPGSPAGEKLYECLTETKLSDYKIRYTNTVRCRPPNNRPPTAEEITACRPYLLEEIEKTNPKTLLLTGNSALKLLGSGMRTVTKERGRILDHEGRKAVVSLHPSAVARKWEDTTLLITDMNLVKSVLDGSTEEVRNYKVLRTLDDIRALEKYLRTAEEFSFDIESRSFDWKTEPLLCIQICPKPGHVFVIPIKGKDLEPMWSPEEEKEVWRLIGDMFKSPAKKIAQNGKFDNKFLWQNGVKTDVVDFDTILAHHLIDENIPKKLEVLAGYYLGWESWDAEVRKIVHKRSLTFDIIPNDILWKYAAYDSDATLRLSHLFKDKVPKKLFHEIVIPMQRVLMHMEMCGVYIDQAQLQENSERYAGLIEETERDIFDTVGTEFKLGSPMQLGKIIFGPVHEGGLGIPCLSRTKTGSPSTRKEDLEELIEYLHTRPEEEFLLVSKEKAIEILSKIREYRNIKHWKNTFIDGSDGTKGLRRWIRPDSRVYPNYQQFGTDTGRIAGREPNLMNIPRDDKLRNMFAAPEGWLFVESDYSQVENRVVALLSGAKKLLDAMRQGHDIHRVAASALYGVPAEEVTYDQRNLAKFVTHGLNYGRSIPSIAAEHGMTNAEATNFVAEYFSGMPEQAGWMLNQVQKAKNREPITNVFGRTRHFPQKITSHEERQALNFPVQSTAADMLSRSSVRLFDRFQKENLWLSEVKMTMTLHDALFFEIKEDSMDKVGKIIVEEMEAVVPELDYGFPTEVTVGKKWKDENEIVFHKGK